jgi:uncharacterized protein YjbI with pentapeptide repeats
MSIPPKTFIKRFSFLLPLLVILFLIAPTAAHADTTVFSDDFTDADGTTWQAHNSLYSKIGAQDATISNNQGILNSFYDISVAPFANGCIATDITLPMNGAVFLGLHDDGTSGKTIYSYLGPDGGFGIQAQSGGGGIGNTTLPSSGSFTMKYCIVNNTAQLYVNNLLIGQRGLTAQDSASGVPSIFTGQSVTVDNIVVTEVTPPVIPPTSTIFSESFSDINGITWQDHNSIYSKLGTADATIANNKGIINGFYDLSLQNLADECVSADITQPINNAVFMGLHDDGSSGTTIYSYITPGGGFSIQARTGVIVKSATIPSSGSFNWKFCIQGLTARAYVNNTLVGELGLDTNDPQTGVPSIFDSQSNTIDNIVVSDFSNDGAPMIAPIASQTISPGGTLAANGSFSDGDSNSWTASVNYGDGTGTHPLILTGTNFSLSHQYNSAGTYTVTINVSDSDGETGTAAVTVTVVTATPTPTTTPTPTPTPTNAPPVITSVTAAATVKVQTAITVNGSFTDPNSTDTHTASWNWGDGNTTTGTVTESNGSGSVSNTHTYTALGTYTVHLTVTDTNGLSAAGQIVIAVVPANGLAGGNLGHLNYSGADFSGQDLSKANLSVGTYNNVNFQNANLSQVTGSNSSFIGDNFTGANLTKINLSGSNLTGSNFTNAIVTQGNLSNVNLTNVNFTGATLQGANLSGTIKTGVIWSNTTCPNGTNSTNDNGTCIGQGGGL